MTLTAGTTAQPTSMFERNSVWLTICLITIFVMGALIRRDEIKAPGHLIEREYNSAIWARAFYFGANNGVETWRKENALATRERVGLLEPPLTEYLVSLIYRIMGREEIWYARYLTGVFWLMGGVFLYRLARILTGVNAALFATAYYLFVPMGIIISRSFQPDSLMMMLFLIALYGIVVYFEKPSWGRLVLAGIITGMTILVRPLVLFALLAAFVAMSASKGEPNRRLLGGRLLVFCLLGLVVPIAYYGYGLYIGHFLDGQADLSFRPYLLGRGQFWLGWLNNAVSVAVPAILICALFGFFFLRSNMARALVIGVAVGYFIFGLIFTYHVHSHPYYHIQLIPILGICAGQFLNALGNTVTRSLGRSWWAPAVAALLVGLYVSYRDVRTTLYTQVFEAPNLAREIGNVIGHSPRTVFVAYHYGLPLEYYGEFAGVPWPISIDDPFYRRPDARELSVQERMAALDFSPEYYVITNFGLYQSRHRDLQAYLNANCLLLARTDGYLIFAACRSTTGEQN